MAAIEFVSVGRSFGTQKILDGINLSIPAGEFLVLVGPSGCGKSTLLRILAGLDQPDQGDILLEGKSALALEPKQRGLSMVFQSYALYPHLSVAENLTFALTLKKQNKSEIAAALKEVANSLQLEPLLDKKPAQLSGGQRQRVALGRALIKRPKIILFDEPLSNLDANLRTQMRYEIKKIHQQSGCTIVYVTHDQVEATTLGDRIAILNKGKLVQVDKPQAIFSNPSSRFVAGFIGSPEINFLPGELFQKPNSEVGLRPEDLQIGSGSGAVTATFELQEYLGSQHLIYLSLNGRTLRVVRKDSLNATPGSKVTLNFDMNHAHFFDKNSGLRQ